MAPKNKEPKGQLFRLRNRRHDVEADLSERDILKRITAGKLTGEEEIATAPHYDRWQKVSAHPLFYDAFLKRLFRDDYKLPVPFDSEDEQSRESRDSGKSHIDRATRQAEAGEAPGAGEEKDDPGKTRQIGDPRELNAGATVHQSVIDELFSNASAGPAPKEEPVYEDPAAIAGASTALVRVEDAPSAEPTLPFEAQALSTPMQEVSQEQLVAEAELEKKKVAARVKRRVFMWGSVVALLLYFLFAGGDKGPKPPKAEAEKPVARQVFAGGGSKETKITSLVREGEGLAANDTPLFYVGALEAFREAQGYDEASPVLLGKVSQAAARLLGEVAEPEPLQREIAANLQRGRLADPHYSQFYRVESIVALSQNKLSEARNFIVNAIESDPTNAENALVLGEISYAMNEMAAAKTSLEEAIKLAPGLVRAHYLLARISSEQGDGNKARAEALEALKLNPLHPPSYLILADVAAAQNQIKEARGLYETCGRLAKFTSKSTAARAYFNLGKLHEMSGAKAEADISYRLAYYYDPKADASLEGKLGGQDLSRPALERLAAEAEYGPAYFREQGEGLLEQGKMQEAVRFFQAAQLLTPKDGLALIRLGEVTEKVAISYEDFRSVMNLYERAIERDPAQARAYVKLGLIETEQYNWDRAYKLLKQAVALAPDEAEPYTALGKYYFKKQDYNEALNQFVEAKKINPSDSEILYYAGMIRLVIKKDAIRDAMPFFYQAYTLNPQNYDALVEWLKLKVLGYEKNFAIKFIRNSIDREPTNPKLYWAMGEIFATNNEARRSITYYHKALDLDNRDSKVRMSLAAALQSVGELDKAVAEYRLASLLDRRNSDGFYKAADLLFQMKNYNQAEEVLKFLISVTPNYPGAHRYLAKIYNIRKQKDQAIAAMEKEVTNNPENYKFTIEFAELYMEYEMWDKAIAQLTRVTNLPPVSKAPEFYHDKIRAFLLLSRCYRAQNKADSAESAIKLALDLDPNDPELHRELGYVYYALQRDKEGVRAFRKYLERSPAARDKDVILGLIQKMEIEE